MTISFFALQLTNIHLQGFWLLEQGDIDMEDLFKRVSYEEYLNGEERKKLKNLEDRSYYDSLFDCELNPNE